MDQVVSDAFEGPAYEVEVKPKNVFESNGPRAQIDLPARLIEMTEEGRRSVTYAHMLEHRVSIECVVPSMID